MSGTPISHMIIAGIGFSSGYAYLIPQQDFSSMVARQHTIKATAILPPTDEMTEIRAFVAMPATQPSGPPSGRSTQHQRGSRHKGDDDADTACIIGSRPGRLSRALQCRHDPINPLLGLGLGQPGSSLDQPGQIGLIVGRYGALCHACGKDAGRLRGTGSRILKRLRII